MGENQENLINKEELEEANMEKPQEIPIKEEESQSSVEIKDSKDLQNRIEINKVELLTNGESSELKSTREKLKETYYEIGRSAQQAGDRFATTKNYEDAISFYKNAISQFENGESQLIKQEIPEYKTRKPRNNNKDAIEPHLKFGDDGATGFASVLNYNLPSSTQFSIRTMMEMDVDLDWFHPQNALHSMTVEEIKDRINATEPDPEFIQTPIPPFQDPNEIRRNTRESSVSSIATNSKRESSKIFDTQIIKPSSAIESQFFAEQAKYYTPEKVQELLSQFPAGHDYWKQFPKGHPLHQYNYKKVNELSMKEAEKQTLELRKQIRNAHNQIKELGFTTLEIIQGIDNTLHAGEFNKAITEISKILKEYQKHDPYSCVSMERKFLEGKFKRINVLVGTVNQFIDSLMERLKEELPMERKIERKNRIQEEIDRYNAVIEKIKKDKEEREKANKEDYEEKVNGQNMLYQSQLIELTKQIEAQSIELKQIKKELEDHEANINKSNLFVQRINKIYSKRDSLKVIEEKIQTLGQKYNAKLQETFHFYQNRKLSYVPTVWGNRLTNTNYQGLKNVYKNQITHLTNRINYLNVLIKNYQTARDRYNKIGWGYWNYRHAYDYYNRVHNQLVNERDSHQKNVSKIQGLIRDVEKKEQQRKAIINEINKEKEGLLKTREVTLKEIKDLLVELYRLYPNTNGVIDTKVSNPLIKAQYDKEKVKIAQLRLEKATINQRMKDVQKDMKIQFIPLSKAHYKKIDEFKKEYNLIVQNTNEEFAKIQVQNKKEHQTNLQTIKDFFLQFLPDDIEKIIVSVNTENKKLIVSKEQLNTLGVIVLQYIEKIYDLAIPYNYHVFINKIGKKKQNSSFAEDMKENPPEEKINKEISLIFEDSIEIIDEEGNVVDASALGGLAAQGATLPPEVEDINIDDNPVDYSTVSQTDDITNEILGSVLCQSSTTTSNVAFTGIPSMLEDVDAFVFDVQIEEAANDFESLVGDIDSILDDPYNISYQVGFTGIPSIIEDQGAKILSNRINCDNEIQRPESVRLKSKKVGDVFTVSYMPDNTQIDGFPSSDEISKWQEAGYSPRVVQTLAGDYEVKFIKTAKEIDPKIFMIIEYTISSFLGDYGAGKTIKTMSLLPGESTTISLKTWKTTRESRESSTSILESTSGSATSAFEKALASETEKSRDTTRTAESHMNAKVGVTVGTGKFSPVKAKMSASVSGGKSASFSENLKNTAKNVSSSVARHARTQSNKRESEVNETSTSESEEGKESSIIRELKNINLSKVLNFVFRQLNQEYITLIHITNIKVAFSTGFPADYNEVAIHELDDFIETFFRDGYDLTDDEEISDGLRIPVREKVKRYILDQLKYIYDYKSRPFNVTEKINIPGTSPPVPSGKYRFKSQPYRLYCQEIVRQFPENPAIADAFQDVLKGHIDRGVDGIVVDVSRHVMRTDAIIIDAVLGKGLALDDYAIASQIEAVREKQLENSKMQLALDIVNQMGMTPEEAKLKADLYYKVFGLTPLKNPFEKSVVGYFPEVKESLENVKL